MSTIKAFKGYRSPANLAAKVACLPYDVMNTEEARKMAEGNPVSFLQIERAEIAFPPSHNAYDPSVYAKAAEVFKRFIADGVFVQDPQPYLYVYQQQMGDHVQTGLVALSSAKDYWDDVIKKHEFTRPVKEQDRINHMKATGIQAGPIFLTYPNLSAVDKLIATVTEKKPDTNFTAEDGVRHTLWVVSDENTIREIVSLFNKEIPFTYIADGHHRAASAAKVSREMASENPKHTGEEDYNFFLSVLFPAKDMYIMDYNRVVKDLNGNDSSQFLKKLETKFKVEQVGKNIYKPGSPRHFGMYLDGNWYKLLPKDGTFDPNDPVDGLDVSILQKNVLDELLGIKDPRTDNRIDFVGGIRGLKELQKRVDSGEMKIAFSLYPVSIEQLIRIADTGQVMPPKSTWFEPKLRSGMVVNKFK